MPYAGNPYQAADPINAGLETASKYLGIKDKLQASEDHAKDRAAIDEERTRRRGREDFEMDGLKAARERDAALQTPIEEAKAIKQAQNDAAMKEAQDKLVKIEHDKKQRIQIESGWLTPEQQKNLRDMKMDAAKVDLDSKRQNIAASKESVASSKDKRTRENELRAINTKTITSMNRALSRHKVLSNPENADAITDLAAAMHERNGETLQAAWAPGFKVMSEVLQDDVDRIVGTKTGNETITAARLSELSAPKVNDNGTPDDPSDDFVELWLDVTTDTGRRYVAPVTQNRTADPDDPVLRLPLSDIENQLMEATQAAMDIQEGTITEDSIRGEAKQILTLNGTDTKSIDALVGMHKKDEKIIYDTPRNEDGVVTGSKAPAFRESKDANGRVTVSPIAREVASPAKSGERPPLSTFQR